jgi:hypothetical protein
MDDTPTPAKEKRPHDLPRYRVNFETSADSPEELQRRIAKGMGRAVKHRVKRVVRRTRR